MDATAATWESLEGRVMALEQKRFRCPPTIHINEHMRRARRSVEQHGLFSARWRFVPEAYYMWRLEARAECLGAPSIQYLCKSLLMENRKAADSSDPTNPKYVLVIVQYAASLDVRKLVNAIRALRPVKQRLDDSQFDFRIASEEDNDRITGYTHNSVTPFGLLEPVQVVLTHEVVPLKFFWMGGGHVHVKVGVAVSDFCKSLSPIVADISQPRTGMTVADLDELQLESKVSV